MFYLTCRKKQKKNINKDVTENNRRQQNYLQEITGVSHRQSHFLLDLLFFSVQVWVAWLLWGVAHPALPAFSPPLLSTLPHLLVSLIISTCCPLHHITNQASMWADLLHAGCHHSYSDSPPGFDSVCIWPPLFVSALIDTAAACPWPWPQVLSACWVFLGRLWLFGGPQLQCHQESPVSSAKRNTSSLWFAPGLTLRLPVCPRPSVCLLLLICLPPLTTHLLLTLLLSHLPALCPYSTVACYSPGICVTLSSQIIFLCCCAPVVPTPPPPVAGWG